MITRSLYTQFLDWLKGEVDAGRVQVKTVHEVVGGALKPKVAVAPRPRAHGQPPRQPVLRAGRGERPALELLGQHQQRPGSPARDHDHERRPRGHQGPRDQRAEPLRQLGHEPDRAGARPRAVRAGRAPRSPLHVQRLVQGQRPDQGRRLVAQRRQPVGAPRLGRARHEVVPARRRLDEGLVHVPGARRGDRGQRRVLRRQRLAQPQLHDRRHEPRRREPDQLRALGEHRRRRQAAASRAAPPGSPAARSARQASPTARTSRSRPPR